MYLCKLATFPVKHDASGQRCLCYQSNGCLIGLTDFISFWEEKNDRWYPITLTLAPSSFAKIGVTS